MVQALLCWACLCVLHIDGSMHESVVQLLDALADGPKDPM